MEGPVVTARDVVKSYGPVQAVRNLDLDICAGEVFALLGPNGAGKTTFVEILEGYRRRTSGQVTVLGVDPERGDSRWRSRLGIVLQNTTVFDFLTVDEVIRHFAGFYPAPLDVSHVIELVGLPGKRSARCSTLSGGQKRRVDLALGLVGNPDLIFLDEPTTGLDPEGRRQLWDVIRSFTALGKTVVLTTHYLDEAEALASRVGVIIAGELVDLGPPGEIGGDARNVTTISFRLEGPLTGRPLPPLDASVTHGQHGLVVQTTAPTAALREILAWADAAGVHELPGLTVSRPSLEDTYLAMVRARGVRPEHENGGAA